MEMFHNKKMQNPLEEDRGSDLFKTSTHTGHHWRPPTYFPSSNFQRVVMDPIPKTLNVKDQVLPETHFQTTTKVFHDNKFPNQDIYNEPLSLRQTKALPSYKVNYIFDVVEKLNSKPRRPLTMAFQKSEYKNEYEEVESELAYEYDRPLHTKKYLINDEHRERATEIAFDDTFKSDVPPKRPIDPSQIGVLNLLDPYMTTYNKEHRKWTRDQLKNEAKQDAITIYDTENLKNADYLNKNQNLSLNMRDEIWFKSDVKSRNVHRPLKPVPNSGLISETKEMFVTPNDIKAKQTHLCPVNTPFITPTASTKAIYGTHEMYNSEYTNIGRGKIGYVPNNV